MELVDMPGMSSLGSISRLGTCHLKRSEGFLGADFVIQTQEYPHFCLMTFFCMRGDPPREKITVTWIIPLVEKFSRVFKELGTRVGVFVTLESEIIYFSGISITWLGWWWMPASGTLCRAQERGWRRRLSRSAVCSCNAPTCPGCGTSCVGSVFSSYTEPCHQGSIPIFQNNQTRRYLFQSRHVSWLWTGCTLIVCIESAGFGEVKHVKVQRFHCVGRLYSFSHEKGATTVGVLHHDSEGVLSFFSFSLRKLGQFPGD